MKTFLPFKLFFGFIVILIISLIAFKAYVIVNAKKEGKTVYEIEVNNFNNRESYTTTDYTRDKETGCIRFKDEYGINHIICNNYSITEY